MVLLWFGFVPSGWFWLADFTTCCFKYKFYPRGEGRDKVSGHQISETTPSPAVQADSSEL